MSVSFSGRYVWNNLSMRRNSETRYNWDESYADTQGHAHPHTDEDKPVKGISVTSVCVRFTRKSMSKPHYLILQCILPHEPLFPSAPCRWVFATHRCASWTRSIFEISTPSRHRVSHCLFQLQQQTLSMCWGRLPPDHDIDWPHISPVILLNVIRPPIVVFHLDHSWSIASAHWSLWRRQHL